MRTRGPIYGATLGESGKERRIEGWIERASRRPIVVARPLAGG